MTNKNKCPFCNGHKYMTIKGKKQRCPNCYGTGVYPVTLGFFDGKEFE